MFTEFRSWLRPSGERRVGAAGRHSAAPPRSLCYVLDEDADSSHQLADVLHDAGIETSLFARSTAFADGVARRTPDLVFLDVAAEAKQAIDAVFILGESSYSGPVQLMGGHAIKVMETVRNMGERHALNMLPALRKPLEGGEIRQVLKAQGLDRAAAIYLKVDLAEAMGNQWLEFWYQPKIDLAKKQIVGVETFARVRHPAHGILAPEAFVPDADDATLTRLSERGLIAALGAATRFAALGINLRLGIDISVGAFAHLPIAEMMRHHAPAHAGWPGLVLDLAEAQLLAEPERVRAAAGRFTGCNVKLAIDDFGHNGLALGQFADLPLAEIKLHRSIVTNCADERSRLHACRTVIELAHSVGCAAVGTGIERAADVHMLRSMGCDLGQGFLFGQPMPEDRLLALLRERTVSPRRAEAVSRPHALA